MKFNGNLKLFIGVLLFLGLACTTGNAWPKTDRCCIDTYILRFELEEPDATFLARLANAPLLIGPGPYGIESDTLQRQLVYQAFADYWGEPPKTPKVIEDYFSEPAVALLALESGEANVACGEFRPEDVSRLEEQGFTALQGPGLAVYSLVFNVTVPPFDDVLVRRGISYAVDREFLSELPSGYDAPLYTLVPTGVWSHTAVFPELDLEKARELLIQAGYSTTYPLDITLGYSLAYGAKVRETAQVLQSTLEQTGVVRVNLVELGWSAYISQIRDGQLGVFIRDWTVDIIDPAEFLSAWVVDYPEWLGTYLNQAVSDRDQALYHQLCELFDTGKQTVDRDERTQIYEEVQRLLADSAVLIPLWQRSSCSVIAQPSVGGIVFDTPVGLCNWLLSDDGSRDVLRIATMYSLEGLNWQQHVLHQISRGLVTVSLETGEIEPSLAESYEISDDGLEYTFFLQKDVMFSDGTIVHCAWQDDLCKAVGFLSPCVRKCCEAYKKCLGNAEDKFDIATCVACMSICGAKCLIPLGCWVRPQKECEEVGFHCFKGPDYFANLSQE